MKSRSFFYYFFPIMAFSLHSCGTVAEPDFKEISNVSINKFGLNESTLSLNLHYFNPNKFRVKLKEAEGDAWIDNNFLGHFVMDTLIQIPEKGDFSLPVKLKVDMSNIFKNSIRAFFAKEVLIKVEGKARMGKGFVFINYPIRYEGKQNLGELLK